MDTAGPGGAGLLVPTVTVTRTVTDPGANLNGTVTSSCQPGNLKRIHAPAAVTVTVTGRRGHITEPGPGPQLVLVKYRGRRGIGRAVPAVPGSGGCH